MVQLSDIEASRYAWRAAAALALAVAFLLSAPGGTTAQVPDSIDLTGEVEAGNCAPCHLRLGESTKPGLIFSHGNHLVVSCTACHYKPAHEGGDTTTPPMEICFNCHGVEHGPAGELATSDCLDCHPESFDFRPTSHVVDWAEEPHARRAVKDTNQCVLCHDAPQDCDVCHEIHRTHGKGGGA